MAPVIELQNLEVKLGGRTILDHLNGAISGQCIGLLGPNGSGKSTLINTLLGFYPPAAGTARIFGEDIQGNIKRLRAMIGYMPESDAFISDMSGVRFVRYMAELSGLPPSEAMERAHEAFFHVGLGEARYRKVGTYSLGMKQLAKLAQALVHGPRLVLLDEPTLEEERKANLKFLELEVNNENGFVQAIYHLGCECASFGGGRLKIVLPENIQVRKIYELAAEHTVQIRRMNYRRDSLEDIFLKAMEGRPELVKGSANGRL